MLRNIGSCLLGLVVFMLFVMAGDGMAHKMSPLPSGLDVHDRQALSAYSASVPTMVFLVMLAAHAVGAFAGGWVVGRISGAQRPAMVIAALMTLGGLSNLVMVPHPMWFYVDVLVYAPAAWLGFGMGRSLRNS